MTVKVNGEWQNGLVITLFVITLLHYRLDPQPTLNHWTDRHQIWNTCIRRGYLPPQN